MSVEHSVPLPPLPLPPGLSEKQITSPASELSYHIIEAGVKGNPLIVLAHGFPEIAYSFRKVMGPLAHAGYYVVAPDLRGYGRTTGWDTSRFEEVDLGTFSVTNLVRDMVVLVYALGYKEVQCIVGHDFGSVAASMCALARPDLFRKVVLMSHPFKGSPILPFDVLSPSKNESKPDVHNDLANLPEPRKHYKWYYSTADANDEMSQHKGLGEFLRGYFYLKSADWLGNNPAPLKSWSASEFAKMPHYYAMPLNCGMRQAITGQMDSGAHKSLRWLPERELDVYVNEYSRTGFQGGLNWYRVQTDLSKTKDLDVFAFKKIEVPCLFMSGSKDWGTYQEPGVIERMGEMCTDFRGAKLYDSAGHWIQQEQPQEVVTELLNFIAP